MTTPCTRTIPCPHCGNLYSAAEMVTHSRACLVSPTVLAAVRRSLEDPANPGRGVMVREYEAACAANNAPSYSHLRRRWGSGVAICAAVGLQPPVGYSPAGAAVPVARREACPCTHCGKAYDDRTVAAHEARCIANPTVHAATLTALSDPDKPGHALAPVEYGVRQAGTAAAGRESLQYLYKNWAGVCEAFGLIPPPLRGAKSGTRSARRTAEEIELQQVQADAEAAARHRAEMEHNGLKVCRVRELPDGRVACMLR